MLISLILGMQLVAYYVELIKYKPLHTTTIEPPFTIPSDCDGNNRIGCDDYTTTSTTYRPFTTKSTEKPTSWTSSTSIKPTWWTPSTTTTTTTMKPWWTPTSSTQKPIWWTPTTTATTKKPTTVTWWKPTQSQTSPWWPKPSTTDTWSQWISTKPTAKPTVIQNAEIGK